MNDLTKPTLSKITKYIIPDSQAVARCLDREILELLNSSGTFMITDLLELIKGSNIDRESFRAQLKEMIVQISQTGHSREYLFNKIVAFIQEDKIEGNKGTAIEVIREALLAGMNCNLLQPDGTGWQKGKLKICFEFIAEQNNITIDREQSLEYHHFPLDEIHTDEFQQRSNDFATGSVLDQN